MKRAKRSEVPEEYRRNYKKEFVEFAKMMGVIVVSVLVFALMFIAYGYGF